jgi:4-hydroxy-2-oxoheptanedioate aldolase
MAHQGWDSLTIDLQHGPLDYHDALTMLQAISTTTTVPLARVPWNEPGVIMKMLDAGCYGIICPMINSRAQAEAFVEACRYPPQGYRSYGPTRATLYAGADYAQHANQSVVALAMVETAEALANVDEIADTPGLDGVYIGPADLSQSLGGKPQADVTDPEFLDALLRIQRAARQHGIVAGIHTNSPEYAARMIEAGFQFVTVMSDARLLAAGAGATVAALKGTRHQPAPSGPY